MTAKTYSQKIRQALAAGDEVITTSCVSAIGKGEILQLSLLSGTCVYPSDNDLAGPFVVALGTYTAGADGSYKIRGPVQAVCGTAVCGAGLEVTPMLNKGFAEVSPASTTNGFAYTLEQGTTNVLSWINIK